MVAVCTGYASRQLSRTAISSSHISRRNIASTACLRVNDSLKDSLMASNATPQLKPEHKLSPPPPPPPPKVSFRPPAIKKGSLASGSIFSEGDDVTFSHTGRTPQRRPKSASSANTFQDSTSVKLRDRNKALMEQSLNPFPDRRTRWERKMVIRAVKNRGQLTKQEIIHQTERELQSKSHFFKTSIKKLGPLARQIAGKNIDDAIVQMNYSKKKAAKDVKAFLTEAKNEAIVSRGMGLGEVLESEEGEKPSANPVDIKLKDGKAYTVTDQTAIYIDQAWVNRGTFGTGFDHRARGQINRLRLPHTALAVILKEDKTRIREWQDRTEKAVKERKSKLWVQLPDRKLIGQSQYYSW